jgi:Zn-dependent M28 family amino/carboxypeptidase
VTRILMAIASVSLLSGCSKAPEGITENGHAESGLDTALATVSRANIQSSLDYLAADERQGRLPGTRGYDESARYVADQFAAIGLEPGGTDGWFQQVPVITRMIDPESSGVTLHKSTGDVDLEWKKEVIIYADPLRPENRIRAEVVFVGFGIYAPELGYSDYEGIDVSGKIVATFRRAPATFPATERAHYSSSRTKAAELVSRGAIGQITLSNRLDERISPWEKATQNAGTQPDMTWIDEGGDVADFHPEHQGYARFSRRAAERLFGDSPLAFEEALDAAEDARPSSTALGVEVTMYRKTEHERVTSPNVVGILRGSDPGLSREYVVYTSHLDHLGIGVPVDGDSIYNGLYDNALGVAMILEAARVLAALPVPPRRSMMVVALTGEAFGLFGSDYCAPHPTVPSSALVANVNIDMPMVIFPFNTVVGYGAEHSSLERLVAAEARKEGFESTPDPFPEEVYFIRTDQYSFVRQGIPCVYLAEGVGSSDPAVDGLAVISGYMRDHWHQPSDDLSQPIEWETALRFARATVRVGYRIAMEEERPSWNEGDFFGERYGRE